MLLAPSERHLWTDARDENLETADDRDINERYIRGEGRIVTETNREKLPGFVKQLFNPNYMELRPFYQRRPRWDTTRQSLLIESFIMNIPVPPIFLYERDFNRYEVMDGQQRITAIKDFYENAFKLRGLKTWPELNGRYYRTLPEKVRAGIDRRSITSIVLLKESAQDEEEAFLLRQNVFERLNTGGVKLERQEIRNALYRGTFNDLLHEISQWDLFRQVWGIPRHVEGEVESNPEILQNTLFSKMGDIEIVLRFFALRHADHYRRGMQGFLDLYTTKAMKFTDEDVDFLRDLYMRTFKLAVDVFDDKVFCPFFPETDEWSTRPQTAFYDAVMVGLSRNLEHEDTIRQRSERMRDKVIELFKQHEQGTFTGRGNTKADVLERINLFDAAIKEVIA